MPINPTYPGVYIQEEPSGVRTITGVATSIAAFVGRAVRGPVNEPVTIFGFTEFDRTFGGLKAGFSLGFAVRDFFLNGGTQAVIVRVFHDGADPKLSRAVVKAGPALTLTAKEPGKWGANLRAIVDLDTATGSEFTDLKLGAAIVEADVFNLTIRAGSPGGASEVYHNVTVKTSPRSVATLVNLDSKLVTAEANPAGGVPAWHALADTLNAKLGELEVIEDTGKPTDVPAKIDEIVQAQDALDKVTVDPLTALENALRLANRKLEAVQAAGADAATVQAARDAAKKASDDLEAAIDTASSDAVVTDGDGLKFADFVPPGGQARKLGLFALDKVDLFNLLCIPPYTSAGDINGDVDEGVLSAAAAYCEQRRAFLLVDAPSTWVDTDTALAGLGAGVLTNLSSNAAVFFPRVKQPDPFGPPGGSLKTAAPCGVVAGVFARTDATRGVWKAPAGVDAALLGVSDLSVKLDDPRNGKLNPEGINCLRSFPVTGRVVWGARTLRGSDRLADEYKYIPVRRTALFIEESLYRGTQFAVFEPNDEPLWAQLRLAAGAFMQNLFRQGAFRGASPAEAYLVKCDKETTTQNDINLGIVNLIVAFAPLKPAEFVVVYVQQLAGQIAV